MAVSHKLSKATFLCDIHVRFSKRINTYLASFLLCFSGVLLSSLIRGGLAISSLTSGFSFLGSTLGLDELECLEASCFEEEECSLCLELMSLDEDDFSLERILELLGFGASLCFPSSFRLMLSLCDGLCGGFSGLAEFDEGFGGGDPPFGLLECELLFCFGAMDDDGGFILNLRPSGITLILLPSGIVLILVPSLSKMTLTAPPSLDLELGLALGSLCFELEVL